MRDVLQFGAFMIPVHLALTELLGFHFVFVQNCVQMEAKVEQHFLCFCANTSGTCPQTPNVRALKRGHISFHYSVSTTWASSLCSVRRVGSVGRSAADPRALLSLSCPSLLFPASTTTPPQRCLSITCPRILEHRSRFSDCCSADFGTRLPANQLYNSQKINFVAPKSGTVHYRARKSIFTVKRSDR